MGAQDPKLITCKPWGKSVLGRISVEPLTTGRKEDVSVIAEIPVHHGICLCVTCERHWVNSVKMITVGCKWVSAGTWIFMDFCLTELYT